MSSSLVSTAIELHANVLKFKNACRLYDIAATGLSRYGSADSEPDGVIQEAVWDTWNGKPHGLKACGKAWELYTASYDAGTLDMVAARLVDNAMPIIEHLQQSKATPQLEAAVKQFCWRFAR